MDVFEKKVLVVGGGKSGIAASALLLSQGKQVILYDGNGSLDVQTLTEKVQAEEAALLEAEKAAGIPEKTVGEGSFAVRLGDFAADWEAELSLVVLSPGVPTDLPFVTALAAHLPIWGEVELAYRFARGRIAAITGTNGKTTTTALTGEIMKDYYESVFVVGNIGIPYTSTAALTRPDSVTVAEISSFQLETIDTFHPQVSAILNITPDHLSWHGSLEAYAAAKWKVLANLGVSGGVAVLDACDDAVRAKIRELRARGGVPFRYIPIGGASGLGADMRATCGTGAAAFRGDGGQLVVAWDGRVSDLVFVDDLQIKGGHNQQNALAAAACALVLGATDTAVGEGLLTFRPLEHRIEPAGLVDGVACYNDSKATNVDATLVALTAFLPTRPIVLLGGRDKGTDLAPLVAACEENARAVVCFGEARERFLAAFADSAVSPVLSAGTMEEALDAALSIAEDGDVVVLSPACASFDEFSCFEERGDVFKRLVADRAGKA